MSEVGDVQRSCRDKHRYGTEAEANEVAAACFEKRQHWLRVYPCDACGGFHLTHKRALPQPGWRPPAKSQRALAQERRERGDRGRRRRR